MNVVEIFGRTVNAAAKEGIEKALIFLQLPAVRIESQIKKKKYLVSYKGFDVVIDYKPKFNQVNLYLTSSMAVLLGSIKILKKNFELRLGAFGITSSELTKAIIKFKK